jgi:hypothetical protein
MPGRLICYGAAEVRPLQQPLMQVDTSRITRDDTRCLSGPPARNRTVVLLAARSEDRWMAHETPSAVAGCSALKGRLDAYVARYSARREFDIRTAAHSGQRAKRIVTRLSMNCELRDQTVDGVAAVLSVTVDLGPEDVGVRALCIKPCYCAEVDKRKNQALKR